jgi:hypothetical protein
MQLSREQHLVPVQPLQDIDRAGGLLDGGPRVAALFPLGDSVAVVVHSAFPIPTGDRPQAGDGVLLDAAAFEVEYLADPHAGQVGDNDETGSVQKMRQPGCVRVADRCDAPGLASDPAGRHGLQPIAVADGKPGPLDELAQPGAGFEHVDAGVEHARNVRPMRLQTAGASYASGQRAAAVVQPLKVCRQHRFGRAYYTGRTPTESEVAGAFVRVCMKYWRHRNPDPDRPVTCPLLSAAAGNEVLADPIKNVCRYVRDSDGFQCPRYRRSVHWGRSANPAAGPALPPH